MEGAPHTLSAGPPRRVTRVQFGLLDAETIRRQSVAEIREAVTYTRGTPAPGGVMDPRLGTTDRRMHCATCGNDVRTCCGHSGHIELPLACFNVGYLEVTRKLLQCVCTTCIQICWDPADARVQALLSGGTSGKLRLGAVYKLCRGRRDCGRCGHPRGIVERIGLTYRVSYMEGALAELDVEAVAFYTQPLYPEMVRTLFQFIAVAEQRQLGFKPEHARPVDLIVTRLVVPPAIIRPAISASEGSRARGQSDITVKLMEINKRCIELRNHMRKHGWDRHHLPPEAVDRFNRLQYDVATLVISNIRGLRPSAARSGFPLRSITEGLKGKFGRFRNHLMGKRVDQSSRSVISPDPTIDLDQVGVPESIAQVLTRSERVTPFNLQIMRRRVANGAGRLDGAEAVTLRDGKCIQLAYVTDRPALDLVPGCLVERYLQNDDQVLFNRQPTLHRMSMMAHRVLIMKGSTFRLNLSCTTPYNADFDGDEMNCHVPQSIAAQTEAAEILGVPHQIVAPQSNKPCMGLVQDTLLGTYLLTSPDTFIDRAQVMQLLMQLKYPADPDLIRLLPRPAVLRPRELWTGAQVFSVLLPRGLFMGRPLAAWPELGQAEVRVHDGQLLHGRLRKQHVGIAAAGIIHLLFLDFDPHLTARFMSEAQRLVNHWLMGRGFSIGIRDCVRPESTRREVAEYVALANHHVDAIAAAARTAGAAASAVEMEDISQDILTKVLAAAGGIVAEHLAGTNLAQTIASGSKGNPINMAQIAGVVGQQCVDGGRIQPPMPCARSLPMFQDSDRESASRGFIDRPYVEGLLPHQCFFHAQGGREGLVDTAVKTARTGYIQRRLVKGMEGLGVAADGSVRTPAGNVVEFVYGSDGWDATWVEKQDCRAIVMSDAQLAARCTPTEWPRIVAVRDRVRGALTRVSGAVTGHVFGPVAAARLLQQAEQRAGRESVAAHGFALETWTQCRPLCCAGGVGAAALELVLLYEWRDEVVARCSPGARAWLRSEAVRRTARARVAQGEMVGCIAAQSIGEPTTQMTLNTFHSAGIGSKDVTQGVPRIQELIDVTQRIKKPVCTVQLRDPSDANCTEFARRVQGARLTEIVSARRVEVAPDPARSCPEHQAALDLYRIAFAADAAGDAPRSCRVVLVFDLDAQGMRRRALVPADVKRGIDRLYNCGPTRLLEIVCSDSSALAWWIRVRLLGAVVDMCARAPDPDALARQLSQRTGDFLVEATLVAGVGRVTGATIRLPRRHEVGPDGAVTEVTGRVVDAAGSALGAILGMPGVDAVRTTSNDVSEVLAVLGIEAAYACLATELSETLGFDGRYINVRHVTTVANIMTCRGFMMQLTRHGINLVETGPLVRCSFEETVDTLFDAAAFGEYNDVVGVTSNIMLGQLADIGTGILDVLEILGPPPPDRTRVVHSRCEARAPGGDARRGRVVHSRMAYQRRVDDVRTVVPALAMCSTASLAEAADVPRPAKRRRADELMLDTENDLPFMPHDAPPDPTHGMVAIADDLPVILAPAGPSFLRGGSLGDFLASRTRVAIVS